MKKAILLLIVLVSLMMVLGCTEKRKLYILNVGDYIDETIVDDFEEETGCKVVYTEVNSNEEIYQKLKNENYDICVVSDYMIDRMYQEGLIQEIDFDRLDNYSFDDLFSDAQDLINTQCAAYKNYFIPYFWGTVGILYNTDVEGLGEYVEEKGLLAMFENNEYKKGMYNSARDAICMALMAIGEDINESDDDIMRKAMEQIKSVTYTAWGDDNLKSMVHQGLIDMAIVYSGDYLDESYQCEVDGEEINFDYFAPEETNIWIDGVVLTTVSKNTDLAYEFLDFINDSDVQEQNADYIGYAPLTISAFDSLFGDLEDDEIEFYYPYKPTRMMYHYVSNKHYNALNDLLEESKSK